MSLGKNDAEQESARDAPDYNPHCMRRIWTNETFREKEKWNLQRYSTADWPTAAHECAVCSTGVDGSSFP